MPERKIELEPTKAPAARADAPGARGIMKTFVLHPRCVAEVKAMSSLTDSTLSAVVQRCISIGMSVFEAALDPAGRTSFRRFVREIEEGHALPAAGQPQALDAEKVN